MRDKKNIVTLVVALACIWGFYKLVTAFAPGSYPYAETYELIASEQEVIEAARELKKEQPDFPALHYLTDGRRDSSDQWFHVYFFDSMTDQIFKTWIMSADKHKTTFAFVGVSLGTGLGDWKEINKDFSAKENKRLIKVFEQQILYPVKRRLGNNRPA